MGYAWIITKDHLAKRGEEGDAGITGPRRATEADLERLKAGEGDTFRLYDDDGILYYVGRLVVSGDLTHDDEEACYAPLGDFGMGWAGCTEVRWVGHPDRNCSG